MSCLQDLLGRAEGIGIVHADEQYIVPTDGKPIRGLIQVSLRTPVQHACFTMVDKRLYCGGGD